MANCSSLGSVNVNVWHLGKKCAFILNRALSNLIICLSKGPFAACTRETRDIYAPQFPFFSFFMNEQERMEEAMGTLSGYSFLLRRDDGEREEEEGRYDMHRLVHLVMRVWMGQHGDAAEDTEKATRHIVRVFPSDDYANRAVWRAHLPHALRLLGNAQDYDAKEKSILCLWVGRCLQVDGRIPEGIIRD